MGIKRRMGALALAVACVVALGSCGSSGGTGQPEEVADYQAEFQQPFEGREARDVTELDTIVQQALEVAAERESKTASDMEETEYAARVNDKFEKANRSYRDGDYAKAQERYEAIFNSYHAHYGANVNLTLALLQQEKNDEALVQALVCCHIFADEPEPILNVQVAGAACGFAAQDVEGALDVVLQDAGSSLDRLKDMLPDEYNSFYHYNQVWDNIETELRVADASAGEAESEADDATAGGVAGGDYATYEALSDELTDLEGALPDDTDVAALSAYLYTVGLQLGYEADPSLIEPTRSMPYIAVDDDLCTIRVVSLEQKKKGDEYRLALEVTNKTEDTTFSLGRGTGWTLNGSSMLTWFDNEPPYTVGAGLMEDFTVRIGYVGEVEVVSVTGMIVVSSQEQNTVLACYPLSWAAPENAE